MLLVRQCNNYFECTFNIIIQAFQSLKQKPIQHTGCSVHFFAYLVSHLTRDHTTKSYKMSCPMDPTDAFDIILRLIEIKEIFLACVYYLFLWYCLRSDLIQVSVNNVNGYPMCCAYNIKNTKTFRLFCQTGNVLPVSPRVNVNIVNIIFKQTSTMYSKV